MTREELLTQIEKLQRRWDYHAIEHRAKRENNNPQYNAYDHGVATGYLKALNTFKDWTMRLEEEQGIELTWEDVKKIVRIADYLMYDAEALVDTENRIGIQPYYEEVLRRFNEAKNEA